MIKERLPQGFTMRPPTMNDVEAVANLMRTNEITIDGQAEITQDDLRSYWQMPNFDIATDVWLVLSPEGQIVGVADLDHSQHAHLYSDGEVHPEYWGCGIGT